MRSKRFFHSLRFKITAGIALPLLVILSAFSYLQYVRQRDLLLSNLDRSTTNLSNVIVGSLQHAMLSQDLASIQGIMDNIAKQEGIRGVFLMNRNSEIRYAPQTQEVGRQLSFNDPGCVGCHGPGVTQHPFSVIFTNPQGERVFRNCNPILNQPECQGCHSAQDRFNGVLITDLSMTPIDDSLSADLRTNVLWSSMAILATILAVNTLMSRMVVTKLERLVETIKQIARGDLSQRVRVQGSDEIGELADSFNRMAEGLGEKAQLQMQVVERTEELEHLNEELRRKETLRGQLLVKLITAQEEERKRIARELHDQLGQALSAMTMGMEAAERALPPELDALKERLVRAKSLATRALEQTHELILDLRPIALDDLGLTAAMRSYAEEHLMPRGVDVQVTVQGTTRRLSPELEIALFRIVQEAVNNIANHAAAQHVQIGLEYRALWVQVIVQDDGRGFDPATVLGASNGKHGFGLLGMQERATLADGTFDIASLPGRGTRITITMPTTV
ncbi:MAG: HAMP domain-containing protein [Chloroflexota bacterium]|nr:HAMP domain-containing protein [Chloroflexota bacterium]